MELLPVGGRQVDLRGVTVVLVDLFVNSMSLPCVGVFQESSLLPCVGLGAYDCEARSSMSTEMQLYADPARSWAVVQQRAPPAAGRQQTFADSLAAFLAKAGVGQVLLLASADASLRGDSQLASPAVRFCAAGDAAAAAARELGFRELEGEPSSASSVDPSVLPPWPMWRALSAQGVPALLLIWHASEGDNTADAHVLATAAAQALEVLLGEPLAGRADALSSGGYLGEPADGRTWMAPQSWGAALYGSQRVMY